MRLDEDAQVVVMAKELSKAADEVIAKRIDHLSMAMAGGE